jgi:hypothetical protein
MKFYRNQLPAVLGKYLFNEAPQTECPTIAIFFSLRSFNWKWEELILDTVLLACSGFCYWKYVFFFQRNYFVSQCYALFSFGLVRTVSKNEVIEILFNNLLDLNYGESRQVSIPGRSPPKRFYITMFEILITYANVVSSASLYIWCPLENYVISL